MRWLPCAALPLYLAGCSLIEGERIKKPSEERLRESSAVCAGSFARDLTDPNIMLKGTGRCTYNLPETDEKKDYNVCPETKDIQDFVLSRRDSLPIGEIWLHENDIASVAGSSNFGLSNTAYAYYTLPTYFGVSTNDRATLLSSEAELKNRFCVHEVKSLVHGVDASASHFVTAGLPPIQSTRIKRVAFSASSGDAPQAARACAELARTNYAGSAKWSMVGNATPGIDVPDGTPLANIGIGITPILNSYASVESGQQSLLGYMQTLQLFAPRSESLEQRLKFVFYSGGRLGEAISRVGEYDLDGADYLSHLRAPNKSTIMSCAGVNTPTTDLCSDTDVVSRHDEGFYCDSVNCSPATYVKDPYFRQFSAGENKITGMPENRLVLGYATKMGVLCADFE